MGDRARRDARPNFDANAADFAKDPVYDPGNKYSMAWQSGLTGVGYATDKVSRPVVSLDDLANPDVVGTKSVGMLKADMPDVVMINLGIDPKTSTPDDWKEAAAWLQMQKDSGTVRVYYDQGYIDDFVAGNLNATMAWSGDVLYYKKWAGYETSAAASPRRRAAVDRQHADPGQLREPGRRAAADGHVYQPEIARSSRSGWRTCRRCRR